MFLIINIDYQWLCFLCYLTREYLRGFQKRKNERRKLAREKHDKRILEERKSLLKQVQVFHKNLERLSGSEYQCCKIILSFYEFYFVVMKIIFINTI